MLRMQLLLELLVALEECWYWVPSLQGLSWHAGGRRREKQGGSEPNWSWQTGE